MAVNLSPIGGVAGQFFDNNGNPLAGGKIFTYAAGTTTNQATYTSASGVIAHSNPIILDAAGRVPSGEIWLTDGLQYKFVIKTSTDVLIGTYDNIVGINSNFINFLTETEIQTATAGQTVFTLTTMDYQPGTNSLSVFVDGVNQYDGVTYAYVETSSTVVTFTAGLHVGALVKFTTAQTLSSGVTDASLVTYDEGGVGAVPTTVQVKLNETVNIDDFGADPTGVLDSSTALELACTERNEVHITNGTYKIDTAPVIANPTNIIIHSDAILTGAGATALGYSSSTLLEMLNVKTSGTDFATQYIRRNANHTGGAPGYVSSALKAYTYVGANATNYEWAITGVVDNSATAGQNTGIYAQGLKRSTGPTWGFVSEVIETTAVNNPATGTVAEELDISVNGTDAVFPYARIGSDLVIRKYNAAGANAQAGWGYRIQGDTGASIQIGFGIYTGMTATFGFDTSQGTILIAALRMAAGQAIAFDASATNKLSYDGIGLNYVVSGTGKVRLNSNGSLLLVGAVNQLNIKPDTSSGSASVSLAANKPGSTSGASPRWIQVDIDNDTYWVPAWIN